MYLLTNAMKNLARNKGRNILIAAVTLTIIVSTVATLTINNAAAKVIDEIRLDIGSKVEIKQDLMEMREAGLGKGDTSYISIDDFYSFAQSEYLSRTIYAANMYAWSDSLFAVDDASGATTTRTNDDGAVVLVETLKLVSTSEPGGLAEFGKTREIVEGAMFSGLNECVISEDLAMLNNVSVGDSIALEGSSFAQGKTFDLVVTGIYSDATDEYINIMFAMNGRYADNRRNEIITSFATLMEVGWESNFGLDMKTAYFLKDPDDIRSYEQEVRSKGLPVTYNVSINQDAYDKVSGPLSGMKSAVMTFMIVILILGAIVLALISFLAVRERKYEVGVLRAMGMERGKVALTLLAEAVMISGLCLVVGLFAGSAMAQPVADAILDGKVAATEDTGPQRNTVLFAGGQMQTNDSSAGFEPESEIRVSLSPDVLVQIIIVTIGLAALSGVVGVAIITQYEPLKILSSRN